MTMWFKLSAIYSISLKICNSMFFYMRSPVTFLQEIYLSSMTGNFNWIYDSVFPRNKPCWTFFLGIYGKLDVLYAGIVAENACAENKNRSVSCHAYFFAKWFTAEVGHKILFLFFLFIFLIRYNNFIYTRYFHQSFPFFQHQALGNSPTNSVVIPQSLMFEFCFHQWKYFFLYPWRFLVFFDDGFAQYLPVKKLHHVYHTGIKCLRM